MTNGSVHFCPAVNTMAERHWRLERQEAEARTAEAHVDAMCARITEAQSAARARRGSPCAEGMRLTALHEAGHVVAALV
jgi:hypothetical protein